MAQKPETRLQRKIQKALKKKFPESKLFKVHGSSFQEAGQPDLIGCVEGRFYGFEVKVPGKGKPSPLQIETLREWRRSGAICCIVESVEEAIAVVEAVEAAPGMWHSGPRLARWLRSFVRSEDW